VVSLNRADEISPNPGANSAKLFLREPRPAVDRAPGSGYRVGQDGFPVLLRKPIVPRNPFGAAPYYDNPMTLEYPIS
jgi:hypothetical protein